MTLIYSNFSRRAGLFCMSDTLLSLPAHMVSEPLSLPLRREKLIHVSNDRKHAAAGLGLKTVIFGRTMVQWAGSSLFAKRLIDEIFTRSGRGERRLDLSIIVAKHSGMSASQISEIALTYHYLGDHSELFRDQINCSKGSALGGELLVAGTGEWDLVHNTVVSGPDSQVEPAEFVSDALTRGLSHVYAETGSTDRYGLSYGGWMEMVWAERGGSVKLHSGISGFSV